MGIERNARKLPCEIESVFVAIDRIVQHGVDVLEDRLFGDRLTTFAAPVWVVAPELFERPVGDVLVAIAVFVVVIDAGFQASRLDTMRSRTSAAYRGLYVLIQHRGAKDFFWKARMIDLDRNEKGIDIHHIFPKKWCQDANISPRIFNSIVNKTAISYKANRKIGGSAPSEYLKKLQEHKAVQLDDRGMDAILRTNCIDPPFLRADDFEGFFEARRARLLALVEEAMGKESISSGSVSENGFETDEDED